MLCALEEAARRIETFVADEKAKAATAGASIDLRVKRELDVGQYPRSGMLATCVF